MKTRIYGLLAETAIHPGSGQDGGLIDQPVAREATTDYPVVVGSAFKGALRDMLFWQNYVEPIAAESGEIPSEKMLEQARKNAELAIEPFFGRSDSAGAILVSDVRLLLLPVRSLNASYYWVTCPHLLERLERDLARCGTANSFEIPLPKVGEYVGSPSGPIYLEERKYGQAQPQNLSAQMLSALCNLVTHKTTRSRLAGQVVVLHDTDFAWFARYGLGVTARNCLERETKASKNLWYEETIPSDSLFYSVLAEREPGMLETLHNRFMKTGYVRVGGNETVGQGWFCISAIDPTTIPATSEMEPRQ